MENLKPPDEFDDYQVEITDLEGDEFSQLLLPRTLTRWVHTGIARARTRCGLVLSGMLAILLLLVLIAQVLSPWKTLQTQATRNEKMAGERIPFLVTRFVPDGQFAYTQTLDHMVTSYRSSDGRVVWRRKLAGAATMRATDQLLYCALLLTGGGQISALSAQDGRIVWSQATPSPGPGSPLLVQDGIVYTNTQDGWLFAFRSSDGKKLWAYRYAQHASLPLSDILAVQDGTATVLSANGRRHILHASDGSEILLYSGNTLLLTIDQGIIFLSQGFAQGSESNGSIQAFRVTDGKLLWHSLLRSNSSWAPVEIAGTVYAGLPNGELLALRGTDGQMLWTYKTQSQIVGMPGGRDGRVYALLQDGSLVAMSARAGSPLWTTRISAFVRPFGHSLLLEGRTLFLSSMASWGNEVYALSTDTGQILWHHDMGSDDPQHSPILFDGIFSLQQNDDSIDAWRGRDGLHLWHAAPLPSTDRIWGEATSGILYREDFTGAIDALRISDGQILWHTVQTGE